MGILRDAISSAVNSSQVQTGLNGSQLPFRNNRPTSYQPQERKQFSQYSQNLQYLDSEYQRDNHQPYRNDYGQDYRIRPRPSNDGYDEGYSGNFSPSYNSRNQTYSRNSQPPQYSDIYNSSRFRPIALPQISYGDGQPFMRGYSDDFRQYNISPETFFAVVDKINIASIPNPENQIFQKAAGIAGWFIPGAASIGLMAGQAVVGAGSAFGHSSIVSRALAAANIEVFLPQGLEICIGNTQNVDQEVGFSPSQQSKSTLNQSPESRIAAYGNSLAQITICSPPVISGGRNDALASMGAALGRKANAKKLEKAQEDYAKGDFKKSNKLDMGLKWLIIRKARPESLAQSQTVLRQTDEAVFQRENRRYPAQQRDVYAQ